MMQDDDDSPPPRSHFRLWLLVAVGVVALAVIYVYLRAHRQPHHGRLDAELFYISLAPPARQPADPGGAISAIRIHYFVRNHGTEDYRFPSRDRLEVMERDGIRLHAGAPDVSTELPKIVPAGQQAELVIEKPYSGEFLPLETWTSLYPQKVPGPPGPGGTYRRMVVTIDVARQLMKRDSLTPEQLLSMYDVVADGPTRECTTLARAILQRSAPSLTGFAILDHEHDIQLECPLPPG